MTEYKYKNVNMKPSIFEELLIEHYDGKQFERD